MMNAAQELSKAKTSVFWDIKTYPVPPECDAGVVGRCVNQYLKKLGLSGPLTIIAVGQLTAVPDDVLRRVSSSGVVLNHVPLGDVGILRSMNAWKESYPAPTNMILISSNPSILPRIRHSRGCNIFRLFPDESLWKDFLLLQDSGEDKCSVTPESAYWLCSVCPDSLVSQGYEKFTTHLSSQEHQINAKRVELGAVSSASVVWDIKGCPVPSGCDPRRVRYCIEQYLKDFGYFGPITITAVGPLTDVDHDVLRELSSSGIGLSHEDFDSDNIYPYFYTCRRPRTIMVICPYSEVLAKVYDDLRDDSQCNVIELFPYHYSYSESLWKEFLLEYSGPLEKDKFRKRGGWVCSICHGISGSGFDNFISHLQKHEPEPSEEFDNTVTVFWNINGYPVPSGCDPRQVRQCIEEYLGEYGFTGPFTIIAFGRLADVPLDVQAAVSSTKIIVVPYSADIIYHWASLNPPPANIMVICPYSAKVRSDLKERGYYVIVPFRYESTYSYPPWEHFLLSYSAGTLVEEVKRSDAYIENPIANPPEVLKRKPASGWSSPTPVYRSDEKDRNEAPHDSLPFDATIMQMWWYVHVGRGHRHTSATPSLEKKKRKARKQRKRKQSRN